MFMIWIVGTKSDLDSCEWTDFWNLNGHVTSVHRLYTKDRPPRHSPIMFWNLELSILAAQNDLSNLKKVKNKTKLGLALTQKIANRIIIQSELIIHKAYPILLSPLTLMGTVIYKMIEQNLRMASKTMNPPEKCTLRPQIKLAAG